MLALQHSYCHRAIVVVIPQFYTAKKISCLLASSPTGTANNILFKSWSEERLKHVHKYFFDKELYYEGSSHV